MICWKDLWDSNAIVHTVITVKGYRQKSIKGKGRSGQVQEKLGTSFQVSPPNGLHGDMLNSLNAYDNTCEVFPTRKAYFSLGAQSRIGVQLYMHAVPV